MMYLTLNAIRENGPCYDGWRRLLIYLGKPAADDEPLSLLTILESNWLDDALWCLRALPAEMDNAVRLLVCDLVQPVMKDTTDPRPQAAIDVARRYARGEATREEVAAARASAWAAGEAAGETAGSAARPAAKVAWDVARDAARTVPGNVRAEQEKIFRAWIKDIESRKDGA